MNKEFDPQLFDRGCLSRMTARLPIHMQRNYILWMINTDPVMFSQEDIEKVQIDLLRSVVGPVAAQYMPSKLNTLQIESLGRDIHFHTPDFQEGNDEYIWRWANQRNWVKDKVRQDLRIVPSSTRDELNAFIRADREIIRIHETLRNTVGIPIEEVHTYLYRPEK